MGPKAYKCKNGDIGFDTSTSRYFRAKIKKDEVYFIENGANVKIARSCFFFLKFDKKNYNLSAEASHDEISSELAKYGRNYTEGCEKKYKIITKPHLIEKFQIRDSFKSAKVPDLNIAKINLLEESKVNKLISDQINNRLNDEEKIIQFFLGEDVGTYFDFLIHSKDKKLTETLFHSILCLISYFFSVSNQKLASLQTEKEKNTDFLTLQTSFKRSIGIPLNSVVEDLRVLNILSSEEASKNLADLDLLIDSFHETQDKILKNMAKFFSSRNIFDEDFLKLRSRNFFCKSHQRYSQFIYIIKIPLAINSGLLNIQFDAVQVGIAGHCNPRVPHYEEAECGIVSLCNRLYKHTLGWSRFGNFSVPQHYGQVSMGSHVPSLIYSFEELVKYSNLIGIIGVHPEPGMTSNELRQLGLEVESRTRSFVGSEIPIDISQQIDVICHYDEAKVDGKDQVVRLAETSPDWFSFTELRIDSTYRLNELQNKFRNAWDEKKCVDQYQARDFLSEINGKSTFTRSEVCISINHSKDDYHLKFIAELRHEISETSAKPAVSRTGSSSSSSV